MKTRRYFSLSSLAVTAAAAVLAFGLAAPSAHAQVGFGISIGTPAYAEGGYAPGYVQQPGYWVPDPDGDGHYRWQPGAWVQQGYQGAYAGYPQYNNYGYGSAYGVQNRYWRRGDDDDHRFYGGREGRYRGYRHDDD